MWMEPHRLLYRRNRLFINVTSLVDVLFILLIFLILSTTFERYGTLEVNLPVAKTVPRAQTVKAHELTVVRKDKLLLDGKEMSEKVIFDGLRRWPKEEKAKPLLLKADAMTPYGEIVRLLDELRNIDIYKVEALTRNE